jgi:prolyl-tRNA synthetase
LLDRHQRDFCYGPTHEEVITAIVRDEIKSYKQLPLNLYQIQTKFRDEIRPRFGVMRSREFIMKDLYSFHTSQEDLDAYYERAIEAYKKIFARCGLGEKTYLTFASGGTFSKYSHEFQTLTDAGEDIIHTCEACAVAVNEEILADQPTCPTCKGALVPQKAVETGNIFKLGTKYSSAFNLTFKDAQGVAQPVIMGCYGIGLGRVMGTVVEVLSDEKGIVWPRTIAPFHIHLISIEGKSPETAKEAERLYKELSERGIEVLWDDRDVRAGEKFADADLIGIPHRLVVSDRSLAEGGFELTDRASGTSRMVPEGKVFDVLARL